MPIVNNILVEVKYFVRTAHSETSDNEHICHSTIGIGADLNRQMYRFQRRRLRLYQNRWGKLLGDSGNQGPPSVHTVKGAQNHPCHHFFCAATGTLAVMSTQFGRLSLPRFLKLNEF